MRKRCSAVTSASSSCPPSDSRGAFELQYAKYAFEQLEALAKKDSYHVIVLTSTVIPGDSSWLASRLGDHLRQRVR